MTALLGAAVALGLGGTLLYGKTPPRKHPGAIAVVRPAGTSLIGLAGVIAACVMLGEMAGLSVS